MSVPAPNASGHRLPRGAARLAEEFRLALGFLTIIPVSPAGVAPLETVAGSFGWFALVGFLIGAVLCVEDLLLSFVIGHALRSVLIVMSLAIVTGAVHLDGLADSADALGAGRNRARALEIMRDSQIGSFGAIALFFVLVLKLVALASIGGALRYATLWLAPGLARWAMVAVSDRLDYLRKEGAGTSLLERQGGRNLMMVSVTVVVAALPVLFVRTLRAYVVAVVLVLLLRASYRRWLGGVTGDLIGAAGELVETAVMIAMSV
ncbi:MAG: adenosylcobinamide-GDP ribazoletransferase [Candidatus Binataceae bacterium]